MEIHGKSQKISEKWDFSWENHRKMDDKWEQPHDFSEHVDWGILS
jgi:hypothetical protein